MRFVEDAPTRVTDRTAVRSGIDRRTIGSQLEIAVRCIHEIGVTVDASDSSCTRRGLDRRVAGKAVANDGLGAVERITGRTRTLLGVHEDTVAHLRAVDVRQIDPARVRAIIEGAAVDRDRSFGRHGLFDTFARMQIDHSSGTVDAAIERAVRNAEALQLVHHLRCRNSACVVLSLATHAEEAVIYRQAIDVRTLFGGRIGTNEITWASAERAVAYRDVVWLLAG